MLRLPGHPSVTLRPLTLADAPSIAHNGNDIDIWRNMPANFPYPYTPKDAEDWIGGLKPQDPEWAICVDDKAVGSFGLDLSDMTGTGQVGYWIGKAYRGRGITTAALRLMIPILFADYRLHRLESSVFSWNEGSMRILERCGFVREAILKERITKEGQWLDEHIFVRFNKA